MSLPEMALMKLFITCNSCGHSWYEARYFHWRTGEEWTVDGNGYSHLSANFGPVTYCFKRETRAEMCMECAPRTLNFDWMHLTVANNIYRKQLENAHKDQELGNLLDSFTKESSDGNNKP